MLTEEYLKRFGGVERLYSRPGLEKLFQAKVTIIGIGGVGSWVAEGLARQGVGELTLIDMDDVCLSNTNRQLPAMTSTVGRMKIDVVGSRLRDINPELKIHLVHDFVTAQNAQELLANSSYVVDAVDGLSAKCAIIAACVQLGVKVVTIGAAAGKRDATKIEVRDLGHTTYDFLLKRVRKKLRHDYQFAQGKKPFFGVRAVFSEELPLYADGQGGVCETPLEGDNQRLDCQTGLGTSVFVTGSMGLVAASEVVKLILDDGNSEHTHPLSPAE